MIDEQKHHISDYGFSFDDSEMLYSYVHYEGGGSSGHLSWTKDCERLYTDKMDWDKIFPVVEQIKFQTSVKIDDKKIYTDGTSLGPHFDTIGDSDEKIERSGYVVPKYEFIYYELARLKFYFYPEDYAKKDYKKALDLFKLEENDEIDAYQYSHLGNYRNTLFEQIKRQANKLNEINQSIASVLKVYFFETEREVVFAKKGKAGARIRQINQDWERIKWNLKNLFCDIQRGRRLSDIERDIKMNSVSTAKYPSFSRPHHLYHILLDDNNYIPNDISEGIIDGYQALMKQRVPILETTSLLVKKIQPIESLMEDFFLNRKIKSAKEYFEDQISRYGNLIMPKEELTRKDIICKAVEVKRQTSRENMYNFVCKWLLKGEGDGDTKNEGYTKQEVKDKFNFGLWNQESFYKFISNNEYIYNQRKNKE